MTSCRIAVTAALALLSFSAPGLAQTCVTNGPELTCTNSGSIASFFANNNSNPGFTTATNSGAVTGGMFGQSVGDGSVTVLNTGTTGGVLAGVVGGNGSVSVTNSGRVGQSLQAQVNGSGSVTVTNSGTVDQQIVAFVIGNGSATVVNSGTVGASITAAAVAGGAASIANTGSAFQLLAQAGGNGSVSVTNAGGAGQGGITATVVGNGSAWVTNAGSSGANILVNVGGNGTTGLVNSGRVNGNVQVSTLGSGSAYLANSGVILGGANLIMVGAGSGNLINSGFITDTGGPTAIMLQGKSPTLTLLPGSFIVGGIDFTAGSTNRAVVMGVGNQNLTFNTLAGATVSGNVPFFVSGNRVVSVDPTTFAMQTRSLGDVSGSASLAIPQITGSAPAGGGPLAFAGPETSRIEDAFASLPGLSAFAAQAQAPSFKSPTVIYADGSAMWGRAFGGQRIQQADGPLVRSASQFYGGMIGGDTRVRPDLRIGGFFGMGATRTSLDVDLGSSGSDLVFGGGYLHVDAGATWLRAVLQGGGSRNSNSRIINNNLLATGRETANASFNGWYVSPEVTVAHRLALGRLMDATYTLTPSLRLRYLYGIFDGYTETGTTSAPLTAGSRTFGSFEERGEMKLTRTMSLRGDDQLATSLYGGVLGTQRSGDGAISLAALGQAIAVASPGRTNVWGGFGGMGLEWQSRNVSMFSAAEYQALSDNSTIVSGRAGLRVGF